jgi:Flp pilus assembly protein TadD
MEELALRHGEASARLSPDDPDILSNFARLLMDFDHPSEASVVLRRVSELRPQDVAVLERLALALREARREIDALEVLQRIVSLRPQSLPALLNLGQLQLAHGKFGDALETGRRATRVGPRSSAAHLLIALSLAELDRGVESEHFLRQAIQLDPHDGVPCAALGFWYQERGRFDEARTLLERSIELNPTHGFAYYNYFRAKKATDEDAAMLDALGHMGEDPKLPIRDRGYMHYAIGKAQEDMGQYEQAMRHYDRGNSLAYELWLGHRPWDREEYATGFSRTIEIFDQERFRRLATGALSTERPIIIVGMIRSGTSLLEQILSSHPDVAGAGELAYWHEQSPRAVDSDGMPLAEPLREVAEGYLDKLRGIAPTALRVTDKLPHNYAMLGLIHAAMPNARILHMSRNPIDNCLSVYTTAFQRPPVFAHSRENIVFAYREYDRIMAHWRKVLPTDVFLEIRYEDLIEDRETIVGQLLEFCGLPWNDACLRHEGNVRAVRTPSLWQVRQPIYRTSMERWRRFEPWIPELVALGNPAEA